MRHLLNINRWQEICVSACAIVGRKLVCQLAQLLAGNLCVSLRSSTSRFGAASLSGAKQYCVLFYAAVV